MKKSIIAAGAASVALAAMPVVGVFADDPYSGNATGSSVDTVRLSINESCTFSAASTAEGSNGYIDLGSYAAPTAGTSELSGDVMTITCNDEQGWTLKATATDLNNPVTGTAEYTIPFGAANTAGSKWTAKIGIDATNAGKVTNNWSAYAAAATADGGTTILTSTTDGTTSRVVPVVDMTVTPTYQAVIGATQQAGTYQGTITYNFATNPSN